jgi:hypothetical protein
MRCREERFWLVSGSFLLTHDSVVRALRTHLSEMQTIQTSELIAAVTESIGDLH